MKCKSCLHMQVGLIFFWESLLLCLIYEMKAAHSFVNQPCLFMKLQISVLFRFIHTEKRAAHVWVSFFFLWNYKAANQAPLLPHPIILGQYFLYYLSGGELIILACWMKPLKYLFPNSSLRWECHPFYLHISFLALRTECIDLALRNINYTVTAWSDWKFEKELLKYYFCTRSLQSIQLILFLLPR